MTWSFYESHTTVEKKSIYFAHLPCQSYNCRRLSDKSSIIYQDGNQEDLLHYFLRNWNEADLPVALAILCFALLDDSNYTYFSSVPTLGQCLYILPGSTDPAFISSILLFRSWVIRSFMFSHADLLLSFSDFLQVNMDHSWAWRKQFLKTNQLSWIIFSLEPLHIGLIEADPWKEPNLSSLCPQLWCCFLRCSFLSGPCLQHPMVTGVSFHNPDKFFVSIRSSTAPLLSSFLVTWWKLSSRDSRNLHFFCLAVLSSACAGVGKFSHEDQGLQMWYFLQLSEETVIYFFFLIKQSVPDTHNSIK